LAAYGSFIAARSQAVNQYGAVLTATDLAELRQAWWDPATQRPMMPAADFRRATFRGHADFSNVAFGKARFDGATFKDDASFDEATFSTAACFESVHFEQAASFRHTIFDCLAVFEFDDRSENPAPGRQREVVFCGWADFRDAEFRHGAGFGGADFESRARFAGAKFGKEDRPVRGSFDGARFPRARTFGPLVAHGSLSLDRASFEAPGIRITISADTVSCDRTHFLARTTMELRFADVLLEDAEFAQAAIVSGASDPFRDDGDRPLDHAGLSPENWRPRVRSLSRANVANLTIADCDLRQCQFVGAHNLEGLRFEVADLGRTRRPKTVRRLIADEEGGTASADQLAPTYRALRKGREDSKDEPGAADFYYGEMEARRRAATGFDRYLLAAYWLVSGYGLRAWRAVAALSVTVLLFAWGFQAWGFEPDKGFWKSLLFSAESTTSLFRTPLPPDGAHLRDGGHVLQMGLRLLGPLFFGLALLAVRGRVKR
jgi:uncharacterized protein YjbI with pentapeptide repeats